MGSKVSKQSGKQQFSPHLENAGTFYEDLLQIKSPEKLASDLLGIKRCVYYQSMAETKILDPRNLEQPPCDIGMLKAKVDDIDVLMTEKEIDWAIGEAVKSVVTPDHIGEVVGTRDGHVAVDSAKYLLTYLLSWHKSKVPGSQLDRFSRELTCQLRKDVVHYKKLLDVVEEFAEKGNPFKVLHEELSKAGNMANAGLQKVNLLRDKFDKAIASEKKKRVVTVITFGIITIAMILCRIVDQSVAPGFAALGAYVGPVTSLQQTRVEEIKEKRDELRKLELVYLSFVNNQEELGSLSCEYDEFLDFLAKMRENIKSEMDRDLGDSSSTPCKNMKQAICMADQLDAKAKKIGENMENVKNLSKEVKTDYSDDD